VILYVGTKIHCGGQKHENFISTHTRYPSQYFRTREAATCAERKKGDIVMSFNGKHVFLLKAYLVVGALNFFSNRIPKKLKEL